MKNKKSVKYAKYGYLFSLPFVITFLIFSLYPIFYTLVIGFTDMKGIGATKIHFLDDPFGNFKSVLANKTFKKALKNTVIIWLGNFVPQIVLALLLTAWFTDRRCKVKGQGLFKVLFYMPNIITAATIAILFGALFAYPTSPMNDLFHSLGLSKDPVYFLQNKATAKGIIIFIQTWMWYGYTMVVMISGVLGINPEIFEAAEVDGANRTQTFFYITLPQIKTILLFTLVTSVVGGLNMFDIPKLFLDGGPDNATITTSVFIYKQAFAGSYLYNRAAAASVIMFIIIAIISAIMFQILKEDDADSVYGGKKRRVRNAEK